MHSRVLCGFRTARADRARRTCPRRIHPSQCASGSAIRSVGRAVRSACVHEQGLEVFDMRYVDEMRPCRQTHGTGRLADSTSDTHLHVSFDVDFLDPDIRRRAWARRCPGGHDLATRESQLCIRRSDRPNTRRLGLAMDVVDDLQPGVRCALQTLQVF